MVIKITMVTITMMLTKTTLFTMTIDHYHVVDLLRPDTRHAAYAVFSTFVLFVFFVCLSAFLYVFLSFCLFVFFVCFSAFLYVFLFTFSGLIQDMPQMPSQRQSLRLFWQSLSDRHFATQLDKTTNYLTKCLGMEVG